MKRFDNEGMARHIFAIVVEKLGACLKFLQSEREIHKIHPADMSNLSSAVETIRRRWGKRRWMLRRTMSTEYASGVRVGKVIA